MAPTYITGADDKFFLMACTLWYSLKRHEPGARFFFCDFGLDQAQASFLESQGVLLRRPPELAGPEFHSFHFKASIGDFLARGGQAVETTVWLDADVTVLAPVSADLMALEARMATEGRRLAACANTASPTLRHYVERWRPHVAPFAAILGPEGLDPCRPYLNSGVYLVRGAEFFDRWRDLTLKVDDHLLFEQNMFNVTAWEGGFDVEVLDSAEWNAHGYQLDAVARDDGGVPRLGKTAVRLAHATTDVVGGLNVLPGVNVNGMEIPGTLKMFRQAVLAAPQREALVGFLEAFGPALIEAGVAISLPPA